MKVQDWGQIDYAQALERQQELVNQVVAKRSAEVIVLCSHPSIVTLGKQASAEDVLGWEGSLIPVQRGGKATYHGPGQIVAYPIVDLSLRKRDLFQYLRGLEGAVVNTLKIFGIKEAKGFENSATGVWVGEKKLASIGIAVRRWVSYHGLAINLHRDPLAFTGIRACGYQGQIMSSVEEILGEKISRISFQETLIQQLFIQLEVKSS